MTLKDKNSSADEAVLIGRILRGRPDLFYDLLEPHLPLVLRVVRSRMRNDPDAEDVVQQTVLKAFSRLAQFQFRSSFRTWLFRIACNEVMGWRRVSARTTVLNQCGISELPIADSLPLRLTIRTKPSD